jgi:hypothetical protein
MQTACVLDPLLDARNMVFDAVTAMVIALDVAVPDKQEDALDVITTVITSLLFNAELI